jgi:hypothetical protein
MRAAGLVCPGAGAGLIRSDLRHVRGTDISCRSGGVIVNVRGRRPRVRLPHDLDLIAQAAFQLFRRLDSFYQDDGISVCVP